MTEITINTFLDEMGKFAGVDVLDGKATFRQLYENQNMEFNGQKNAIKYLEKQIEELKDKITCLESDSDNEVSLSEHEDALEDKDWEITKLKEQVAEDKNFKEELAEILWIHKDCIGPLEKIDVFEEVQSIIEWVDNDPHWEEWQKQTKN